MRNYLALGVLFASQVGPRPASWTSIGELILHALGLALAYYIGLRKGGQRDR